MLERKFRLLADTLQDKKRFFIGAMIATLITVIAGFLSPLVYRTIVDSVIGTAAFEYGFIEDFARSIGGREYLLRNLWIGGIAMVSIQIVSGFFQFLVGRWSSVGSERFCEALRNRLYFHIANLPYNYHVRAETGDLIQRCSSDVETTRRFLSGQMVQMLRSIASITTGLIIMFSMNVQMTLVALVMVPFVFVFSMMFFKLVTKHFRVTDEAEAAMTTTMQENFTGMRVVRAFGRQRFEIDRFDERNSDYRTKAERLITILAVYWSASDLMCMLQTGIVLVVGAFIAISDPAFTVGTLMAFVLFEDMMLWPVRQLGRLLNEMGRASVALDRIDEILREKQEQDAPNSIEPALNGEIVFDHVSFSYDGGREVLSDVSFTVSPGQTVAILGPTGSGKSTLMLLLQRLYDYQSGSITIGGKELNTIKKKHLRDRVGIVLQEPFLYSRSIRNNVAIVDPDMPEETVIAAAKDAHIHEVIMEFDKGYETEVGERGVTLSGGQKQRVAIARTLARQNDILVFDDSLSAVDTQTDAAIRKALGQRTKQTTTFIISHRITTLSEADLILVLENGSITQQGTHEELIAQEGLYKRIFNIQNQLEDELSSQLV